MRSLRRDPREIPVFGFDYLSASELQFDEKDQPIPVEAKILVAHCQKTKCVFAHVVPQKGIDPERYAVERLSRDIQWLGHPRIILKSDNEKSIVRLLTEVLKSLRATPIEQVAQQHPSAYDPNSNGAIESTCKRVGGLLRTLKFDFEERFGRSPSTNHPVFAWLVEHVSWILTTRVKLTFSLETDDFKLSGGTT